MKQEELKELFKKYHEGKCTPEEKALLESWYLAHEEADPIQISKAAIRAAKDEVFRRLPGNENSFLKIGYRLAAAACIIGLLITVTFITINSRQQQVPNLPNDILPGKNKATLTLRSGQRINLTDALNGRILSQHSIAVIKKKSGQVTFLFTGQNDQSGGMNSIVTPRGGQWEIQLPDGTGVWLNSASTLTFPTSFANKSTRTVNLTGEAYFEVAKDRLHPFIVNSAVQKVEVLGTHFNINSYADEPAIKTTLIEGKVNVSQPNTDRTAILHPGQQSILSERSIQVMDADTDEALSWKNGYIQFEDEPIESVMRKLARWYDIEVQYNGPVSTETLSGRISRTKNISQVINALDATKTVHFKVEGRRVTVMR